MDNDLDLGEPVGCPFCGEKTVWAEIMTTVNFFSEHQMYSEDFNMEGVTLREIIGEMKHAPVLKYMGFRCASCGKEWYPWDYDTVKNENGELLFVERKKKK